RYQPATGADRASRRALLIRVGGRRWDRSRQPRQGAQRFSEGIRQGARRLKAVLRGLGQTALHRRDERGRHVGLTEMLNRRLTGDLLVEDALEIRSTEGHAAGKHFV